jgi:hypothetical protein
MAILSREPTMPDPHKKDGHFTVCAMRWGRGTPGPTLLAQSGLRRVLGHQCQDRKDMQSALILNRRVE